MTNPRKLNEACFDAARVGRATAGRAHLPCPRRMPPRSIRSIRACRRSCRAPQSRTIMRLRSRRMRQQLTFDATVAIDLEVVKPTRELVLNAADMTFSSASLAPAGGGAPLTGRVTLDDDDADRDDRLPWRACARRLPARPRLFGQDQHAGQWPVRARLQEFRRQGPRAVPVHPVRGRRCAAVRAELG